MNKGELMKLKFKPHEYLEKDIKIIVVQAHEQEMMDSRNIEEVSFSLELIKYLYKIEITEEIQKEIDYFVEEYLEEIYIKRGIYGSIYKHNLKLRKLKKEVENFLIYLIQNKKIKKPLDEIKTENLYQIFDKIIDIRKLKTHKDKRKFTELKKKSEKLETHHYHLVNEHIRMMYEYELSKILKTLNSVWKLKISNFNQLSTNKMLNSLKSYLRTKNISILDKTITLLEELKIIRNSLSHGEGGFKYYKKTGNILYYDKEYLKLKLTSTKLSSYFRLLAYYVDISSRFFLMKYCEYHKNSKSNELFDMYENYLEEIDSTIKKRDIDYY